MVCTSQLTFDIFTTIGIFGAFDNVALGYTAILSLFLDSYVKHCFSQTDEASRVLELCFIPRCNLLNVTMGTD